MTQEFTVLSEGKSATTDRCEEHGEVLRAILEGVRVEPLPIPTVKKVRKTAVKKQTAPKRATSRRGSSSRVVTLEEIEASKTE